MPAPEPAASEQVAGSGGRSTSRNALGLLVSAVSLVAFAWWATGQERPTFPTDARGLALIACAIGVYGLATLGRGWRWHEILLHAGIRHRASDAYGLTVVGYMGNTVLPGRGGELLRILLMADRAGCRRREVLGSIIAERLLDAITFITLLVVLSFSGVVGSGAGRRAAVAGVAVSIGLLTAFVIYKRFRRQGKFARFADLAAPIVHASRSLANRHGAVLASATFGIWCLEAVVFWLVTRSVDADVSLAESLFVIVFVSVAIAIPAGPGYLGTLDSSLVFALGTFGVSGSTALSIVVLFRFVVFVPVTIAGFVLLVGRYGGFDRLRLRSA